MSTNYISNENSDSITLLPERFVFDDNYNVIDNLNPTGPKYPYCRLEEDPDESQRSLRKVVLWQRLDSLVDDLILNQEPAFQPRDDAHWVGTALYTLICASALNRLEPSAPLRNRFDGKLKRKKTYLQEVTALWLFRDDVERLLRDLYGDHDSDALDEVLRAVLVIVRGFAQYVRPDVFREHLNAMDWDYISGAGVPPGCGISGGDHRRAHAGLDKLLTHVREVRANPSGYGKYTVEFATRHVENFVRLDAEVSNVEDQGANTDLELSVEDIVRARINLRDNRKAQ